MSRRLRTNKGFLYFGKPDKRAMKRLLVLPGFEKKNGRYRLPDTKAHRILLQQAGFYLYTPPQTPPNPFEKIEGWEIVKKKLRPYQIEGVLYLDHCKRILLGDEQGLGKTVQVLSWLYLRPDLSPILIVCPSHLKENWRRECLKWAGESAEILQGQTPYKVSSDILIINYEILPYWKKALRKLQPQVLCVDECQRAKNRSTQTAEAIRSLSKVTDHFIPMSGTPIKNRPEEFYSILNMLAPEEFPNFQAFAARYCDPKKKGQWWDYSGHSNTGELHDRINKRLMIRRKKAKVLKDLPPKEIVPVLLDPPKTTLKEYRKLLFEYFEWKSSENKELRNWMEELKQECLKAKIPSAIEWIRDFLDSGEKLIVFTTHHYAIDEIKKAFPQAAILDGRVKGAKRQEAVDSFMKDPKCKLFAGNLKSAGEGLTLTSSSSVAFIELGWNPADHSQGEDRVHRIGQEAERVCSYYLIVPNTIEEKIWNLLESKRTVLDQIIDGKTDTTEIDIKLLYQKLREEAKDA